MNVEDLLRSKNIKFTPKGSDFLINCLNPEHPDLHPSMRIDQITGIYNCFACGYKGNIFTLFGETPNEMQQKREKLKKLIRRKRAENIGLSFPNHAVPYDGDWRNIKPETYKKFEAFLDHTKEFSGRIIFPIRDMSGRIVAFNGRHTSGGLPKYLFSPSGVKLPLFPVVEPINGSVILVEGIFDVLNLHDKGLTNAVCCFGTKNINKDKLAMLKMRGVDSIKIFFDGDEAGQDASASIKTMAENIGLNVQNIYLKDTDPGDLNQELVSKLYEKLYG
jgi:DNA primase